MGNTKNCSLPVRVSEQDKAKIEAIAKARGTSVSQYIRTVALSDPGSLFLENGKKISESLGKFSTDFHDLAINGTIPDRYYAIILTGIEDVMASLNEITAWIRTDNGGNVDVNSTIDEPRD